MQYSAMGRTPTVSIREAANLLQVSDNTVRKWVKAGKLRVVERPETAVRTWRLDAEEVLSLSKFFQQGTSFIDVALFAVHAQYMAQVHEKRLERLERLLGLNTPHLGLDFNSVIELYLEAEALLQAPDLVVEHELAMQWATRFMGMNESYFYILEDHAADPMAWKRYVDLSQRLLDDLGKTSTNRFLTDMARGYAEAARRHIVASAYFFLVGRRGEVLAKRFLGGLQDLDDAVIAFLYPH